MVAAPYCAKLLGDLGADVIKLERPGTGDRSRLLGPFPQDVPHAERSALFLYLNTSKRSVTLDLASQTGRETFGRLASGVDILVEDRPPGELAGLGLGYAALADTNSRLIVTSITPFGQTGPNRAHKSEHLNLYHSAGHASPFQRQSIPLSRAASKAGGYLGEYDAGLMAAVGTLAAVLGRELNGRGQHVDVSKQEAMMGLERVTIGRFANEPDPFSGRGPGGLVQAKDGYLIINTLEPRQWEGLLDAMGRPEWGQADWCKDPAQRVERMEEIQRHIGQWAAERTRDEIYHMAQNHGTPSGPVRNVEEVMAWNQARERKFFRELIHPEVGPIDYPTGAYRFSGSDWVGSAAPLLGQHNPDVNGDSLGGSIEVLRRPGGPLMTDASRQPGPLSGIRVADFTWAWAGPQGSLLLSMLGAEVIKIESRARLDHSRVHTLTAGSLTGGIDASPVFNDLNLGKRSLTLNLKKTGARVLVKKLVAQCDIVLQNMRPGVLDRMGLGYPELQVIKPDLIMLSSSAMGATGPERTYTGYAPTFACLSGMVDISGHPDEPPIALSGSVDLRVGTASAFAVLAALIHRKRTGEGQNIDLSSTEVISSMMGEAFVGYGLNGRIPHRIGNRDSTSAPQGCYRCLDRAGDPQWVTIAVTSESDWMALTSVIADPQLEGAEFATPESRLKHHDALDEILERWTAQRSNTESVEALQSAGVAAAIVHSGKSLASDHHLSERGIYQSVEHPLLGEVKVVGPPWRMDGARIPGPAPLLGQHNEHVLKDILGLTGLEIDSLIEDEVVF